MRKRIGTYLSLILLAAFMCASCSRPEDDVYLKIAFDPDIISSEVTSVYLKVACSTSWTLEIEDQPEWVKKISATQGLGNRNNIILSLRVNDTEEARSVEVTAKAGGLVRKALLVQRSQYSSGTAGIPAWLELPDIPKKEDFGFFWHDMTIGSVTTRNYSYYYDFNTYISHWVAYPLCAWNIGTLSGRGDAWGVVDGNIAPEDQQLLGNAYQRGNGGWYARGHQCPDADRKPTRDAQKMTYYGTNMTPQLQDKFNGSIWANLESQVREWAGNSDTLYVVTGCVLTGSTTFVYDAPGKYNEAHGTNILPKKVPVPTGYFKAALRYSPNSTLGYGGYMGFAVFLDHRDYTEKSITKSMSMSIDALEEKLGGVDLFANLPDFVGDEKARVIEAEDPATVSWWW